MAAAAAAAMAAFQASQVEVLTPHSRLCPHPQKILRDARFLSAELPFESCKRAIHPEAFQTSSRSPRFSALTLVACMMCYLHYGMEERTRKCQRKTTPTAAAAESQQLDSFNHRRLHQRCSCCDNSCFYSTVPIRARARVCACTCTRACRCLVKILYFVICQQSICLYPNFLLAT